MATLLLRLAAPMQSWGVDSKFEFRQTRREPSKSGVIGMLAAALGCMRNELPEALLKLRMSVRVDQEGQLLEDFHTVHGIFADEIGRIGLKEDGTPSPARNRDFITRRQYLCDAVFLVALECDDASYLQKLAEAVCSPVYPLFLGRRSCPPTLPIVLEVSTQDALSMLTTYPSQASESYKHKHSVNSLRLIMDAQGEDMARPSKRDMPVSFHFNKRTYAMRSVSSRVVPLPQHTEHDPISELD